MLREQHGLAPGCTGTLAFEVAVSFLSSPCSVPVVPEHSGMMMAAAAEIPANLFEIGVDVERPAN